MKALIQRVSRASVIIDGREKASISKGLLVLLGVEKEDTPEDIAYLVRKLVNLRIFENTANKFDLSLQDTGGEALVVSQFTLMGKTDKGNRPDFTEAAAPEKARRLYIEFIERMRAAGIKTEEGVFGAKMDILLNNDGPVTLLLESRSGKRK